MLFSFTTTSILGQAPRHLIHLYTQASYRGLLTQFLPFWQKQSSIFARTWVVVPTNSAKQWLQKSIADETGICAQIDFMLPKLFFWKILSSHSPSESSDSSFNVFQSDAMRWQIFEIINQKPDYAFLKKDHVLQTFNFAENLAQTFIQYLNEQPQKLQQWQTDNATTKHWQQELWLEVLQHIQQPSPITLLENLQTTTEKAQFPAEIFFFGVEDFSPLQIESLKILAKNSQVHVFISNPSAEFWFDLSSRKKIKKQQAKDKDPTLLYETGNPLLANLGTQKQILFESFLNCDADFSEQTAANTEPKNESNSLFASLKKDIATLTTASAHDLDDSITVHACHSKFREIEIVKDAILHNLDSSSDHYFKFLKPEDILIVAPDINEYVFAINHVFATNPQQNLQIPYHINRLQLQEQPYIKALMALLASFHTQMSAENLFALMSQQAIMQKFGWKNDDLPRIKNWIMNANIRRFYCASHKQELGFEATIGNSWQFGKNRWLAGYLAGDVEDVDYLSVLGHGVGQEYLFAPLFDFLETWFVYYKLAQKDKIAQNWAAFMQDMVQLFLHDDKAIEQTLLLKLNHSLIEQSQQCTQSLSLSVVEGLVKTLVAEDNYQSVGKMGVRFQTWSNAFVADVKLLIILGMNESSFPQKDHKNDLDIFQAKPAHLHHSPRNNDKNLLLNALSESHEKIIFCYQGFDEKSNEELPPSLLLSEIISILQEKTQGQFAVTKHKMHGFNQFYYQENSRFSSYNPHNFSLAQSFYKEKKTSPAAPPILFKQAVQTTIELQQLQNFFCDPVDYFLKHRADLKLNIYQEILKDNESYQIDGLEKYALRQELLTHGATAAIKTGIISDNKTGRDTIARLDNELQHLHQLRQHASTQEVDKKIDQYQIFGTVLVNKKQQLISIEPAKLTGKRIAAHWIKHLCFTKKSASYLSTVENTIEFAPLETQQKDEILLQILAKWQQSFQEPWFFCPQAAIYGIKIASEKKYHASFVASQNMFPSEGQQYFAKQLIAQDYQHACSQFIQVIIDSIGFMK